MLARDVGGRSRFDAALELGCGVGFVAMVARRIGLPCLATDLEEGGCPQARANGLTVHRLDFCDAGAC